MPEVWILYARRERPAAVQISLNQERLDFGWCAPFEGPLTLLEFHLCCILAASHRDAHSILARSQDNAFPPARQIAKYYVH
jgi:hypothetical protein